MKGMKYFFCASPASTAIVSGHRERLPGGTCSSSNDGEKRIRSRPSEQSDLHRKSSAGAVVRSRELVSSDSPNSISSVSSVDSEHAALCPPKCDYETFGVVDLEVAIDCKACERKVRKHISKMKGVKSFSIETETKKVTIRGDVSPLGVLESVSKVKRAQLWSS